MLIRRVLAATLAIVAALLGLLGCANYQLGTGATPDFTTLYVAPVENHTLVPQARALLSTHLREAFERDGRVTIVNSPEAADATLHVVIQDFDREVASVLESDTRLARKFTLTLSTSCTLRNRHSDKPLFTDRTVSSQRDAFTDGGQLQSEYQTLPLLAEALAKKITHTVLDVW